MSQATQETIVSEPHPTEPRPSGAKRTEARPAENLSEVADATMTEKSKVPLAKVKGEKRGHVNWTMINFWLDTLLGVMLLALAFVAVVTRFVFPVATSARGWTLWGMGIDGWLELQFALVAIFTLGVVVHLMLHWTWICGIVFRRLWVRRTGPKMPDDGTRTIFGVGLLIVLLNLMGLFIAIAALTVQSPI